MSDSEEKILLDWVPGTHNYHVRATVMTALSCFYSLSVIVSTVMFVIVARNKRSGLEKRSVKLVVFQAVGCYLAGVNGLVTAALNNWACFGKLWLFNLGLLISLSAMSARAIHLMIVYTVHKLTSELNSRNPLTSQTATGLQDTKQSKDTLKQQDYLAGFRITGLADVLSESVPRLRQARKLEKYKKMLPFITERMLFVYMAAFVLLGVILTFVINATDKQFAMRPETQQIWPGMSFIWIYAVFIHITSIIIPLANSIQHMRHAEDQEKRQPETEYNFPTTLPSSLNLGRRAAFNKMLDCPIEYQSFRVFAASCFCSELTGFIEDYQLLKARTVLVLKNRGGSSRLSEMIPAMPDTFEMHKIEKTIIADKETTINRIRLSQCIVDSALAVYNDSEDRGLTGFNVSIIDTVLQDGNETFSAYRVDEETEDSEMQFPEALFERIGKLYKEHIDPRSFSSVNASASAVKRITERIESKAYPLTLFDDVKSEVMFMLYSDVYLRYIRR